MYTALETERKRVYSVPCPEYVHIADHLIMYIDQ